ncbi:glutaredoxin family protein [Oceanihabitans sp. 2_MG-2023]|uniref:glutaredoxin family protein n=1 Tax=Oceanihabitans sp. 2_MG-2023 TaxID=3062661 RepID=UPI0026E3244A|nr:glutaredoxin family protein [Oceanihabitans sp. 2_MG-2023]MDO6597619.1 glutaredoxin family protein [Oceanihabitans sp. 2_MG-2023]
MKFLFLSIFILLFTIPTIAQNDHEFVRIEEKSTGKRVELFAVNTNDISYDVFLKVDATGYRRSSARPIIKTIPANSKVRMITLVKLVNEESKYNYTLVVNEVSYEITMQKDDIGLDFKIDDALTAKTVTLFTKENCLLCNQTKSTLSDNKINYQEINIDQDSTYLIGLLKEFKKKDLKSKATVPVLKIDDSLYTNIKTQKELIKTLQAHY